MIDRFIINPKIFRQMALIVIKMSYCCKKRCYSDKENTADLYNWLSLSSIKKVYENILD